MFVEFDAELWVWQPKQGNSWIFVSLPVDASEDIREMAGGPRPGFGSVKVRATIGNSTWATSIFPEKTRKCYVLPVKRAIRVAERIDAGDVAAVTVEVLFGQAGQ